MIKIQKSQTNNLIFTLTEKTTIEDPYFVWQSEVLYLDLDDALSIVESGKCVVKGEEDVTFTYEDSNDEITFN